VSYTRYLAADPVPPASTGWDRWATDYAALGENPTYALAKALLHELVDEVAPPPRDRDAWALDFHCGAGDDLARLLARGWCVVGCDGSRGMLDAAASRCTHALASGQLELWCGRAEELAPASFRGRRFDLIFSTTGGFAYLDDEQVVRVHRVLAAMLAPGGVMVIAHLTPFCAAESLYHLGHLRVGRAIQRWRRRVPITVRGEPMTMRLRSPRHIRRLLSGVVDIDRMAPLLACTPPFQSGFVVPGSRSLAALRAIERRAARVSALAALADQVVCVARARRSSSNSER
jgi:SAM-dependent methyltransferase